MSQSKHMGDLITRVALWDPDKFKELMAALYAHLAHAYQYYPDEDGIYQGECSHKECPFECWHEIETFLTRRELDPITVIEHLEDDLSLYGWCERDLIHRYCLEEVIQEIDYQSKSRLKSGEKMQGGGIAACGVLKISDQDDERMPSWQDDSSEWQISNLKRTAILLRDCKAHSGIILNDIKKAYAMARRGFDEYFFPPTFVSSCLITASMDLAPIMNKWANVNEPPSPPVHYWYLLILNEKKGTWRLEGQRFGHGIFLIDEWEVKHENFNLIHPYFSHHTIYDALKTSSYYWKTSQRGSK